MNSKLLKQNIIGFVFVGITGSISHFIYEWSGFNRIAGLFFPINESSWEHLKLLFLPYLIWTIIISLADKGDKIFFSKAVGVSAGMLTILLLFYTYTGISGKSIDFINILIFFIGVFVAFAIDYIMTNSGKFNNKFYQTAGIIVFAIYGVLFLLFTYYPPLIPLFRDPIDFSYGI